MEMNRVAISQLNDNIYAWVIRVAVVEKSLIRHAHYMGRKYQRYVFADDLGDRIQGIVYLNDVQVLDEVLQLYSTYYIGSATVRRLTNNRVVLGMVAFELVITQYSFIQLVDPSLRLPIDNIYNFTPFANLGSLRYFGDSNLAILAMVIEVLPLQIFIIGGRYIWVQEFIILNEEMRPMIFAMWEDFLESEGMHLVQIANEHPVVLICRPKGCHLLHRNRLLLCITSIFHELVNYTSGTKLCQEMGVVKLCETFCRSNAVIGTIAM
ncbi:replication protein A 70 kDa DNA-binding subunit D-like isoform X1 [Coffea arabica]|uniref:Replication protein A 70 kDa DNA-binding subunit D-like isoform X1 n=1 Tax=Coffea arabica TaxID=13443 RepID=A0ABM4U8W3_COFAR